jgi:hypothetical protein
MDSSPSYLSNAYANQTATAGSVTNVPGERNQCLSFTGTINSYFQISNLVSIGTPNNPFSIALYVNPNVLSGTIVHISMFANGIHTKASKISACFLKIDLFIEFLNILSSISAC